MPREGRELELIIEELEKLSLGDLAEIKSPDRLEDVVTGGTREVDVSIRLKVGSHQFLTVIECRDRKYKEDVMWIEQLISKAQHIKTDKMIAVSKTGFSEPAKKMAEHYNIILRTLEEFDANEVISWFGGAFLNVYQFNPIQIDFKFSELNGSKSKQLNEMGLDLNLGEKVILVESTGEHVSFSDMVYCLDKENDKFLFGDLEANAPPVRKGFIANYDETHIIEIEDKKLRIDSIRVVLDCWKEYISISPQKSLKYKQGQKSLLEKIEVKANMKTKEANASFTRDYTGGRLICELHFDDLVKK